jgi:3D (Asp-Asp-Asp) domain-containing protein
MNHLNLILSFIVIFLPTEFKNEENRVDEYISSVAPSEVVTITTYTPSVEETDSTPLITASGFKINERNPRRHRIVAVSRDLKRKYKFGTKLRIKGAGKYDGTYTVRDVMNKRFRKRIDILVGKKDKQTKVKKVKVYKIK